MNTFKDRRNFKDQINKANFNSHFCCNTVRNKNQISIIQIGVKQLDSSPVCLDDMVIYSPDFNQHLIDLEKKTHLIN